VAAFATDCNAAVSVAPSFIDWSKQQSIALGQWSDWPDIGASTRDDWASSSDNRWWVGMDRSRITSFTPYSI
jgi:hypothetical protein